MRNIYDEVLPGSNVVTRNPVHRVATIKMKLEAYQYTSTAGLGLYGKNLLSRRKCFSTRCQLNTAMPVETATYVSAHIV